MFNAFHRELYNYMYVYPTNFQITFSHKTRMQMKKLHSSWFSISNLEFIFVCGVNFWLGVALIVAHPVYIIWEESHGKLLG